MGNVRYTLLAFGCYKRFSPDDIIFESLGRFDKNQERRITMKRVLLASLCLILLAGTILKAVQADPREAASYFLVGVLCTQANVELDVKSFTRHPELITKAKSRRTTLRRVSVDTFYVNSSAALAVTSKGCGHEYRRLVLRLSKENDRWLVTDVQIEMESQEGEALRNFLQEYPNARIVKSAVRVGFTAETRTHSGAKTINRYNLFEVARSSNYKVGPEWFMVVESPDNSIFKELPRHAELIGEPRFNEILDDWVRWKYELDRVVDMDSAMALFETFCDQFDAEQEFDITDPRARAIKLICNKLNTNELIDRYVMALDSGRSFYRISSRNDAFLSINEPVITYHKCANVLPASLSAVWYALRRADEKLDALYPKSRNIIEDTLTPIFIRRYKEQQDVHQLDPAVLLGGQAIAEFLLQKDWRDERGEDNREFGFFCGHYVNSWLFRLINLDDPAGETFRAEHRDLVVRYADMWAESNRGFGAEFKPPSFLLFDRDKGRRSFAWQYWPVYSIKKDSVKVLTHRLRWKFEYLKMLEPFATTQMYFDCWVRALDKLEDSNIYAKDLTPWLPLHRKKPLATMLIKEINKRLENLGPTTEETHKVWAKLDIQRDFLSDLLNTIERGEWRSIFLIPRYCQECLSR